MSEQKAQHWLYEGEVEVWAEQIAELGGSHQIILRDGPADLGQDLGDYLRWMLGPGRAIDSSRCRMAKRLRIIVDDLEADDGPERREVDGDPLNTDLAELIKSTAAIHKHASPAVLATMRHTWQVHYRRSIQALRYSYMLAATYELLAAQAERKAEEEAAP